VFCQTFPADGLIRTAGFADIAYTACADRQEKRVIDRRELKDMGEKPLSSEAFAAKSARFV